MPFVREVFCIETGGDSQYAAGKRNGQAEVGNGSSVDFSCMAELFRAYPVDQQAVKQCMLDGRTL